jgi:uncharacterized glyoxalase superfamily protein PhnB
MEFAGICLITKNVPVLVEFYKRVLGIDAEGDDIHAELKTQGGNIAIFSYDGMEDMAPHSMEGSGYGSFTISFKIEDVDAEFERLKMMNVDFVKPPQTYPWGSRSLWIRDPDGNIINLFCTVRK